ncbi:hypothetical protein F4780DRAFT_797024 [Xylariomycetidae sp. FL0641]|nr:hypothetical protein F4780DRAFT_797024 [Xylariomycetidae sp. FL0641]
MAPPIELFTNRFFTFVPLEAKAGRVVWDDTDEETFRRLLEFTYSEDYNFSVPCKLDTGSKNQNIAIAEGSAKSKQSARSKKTKRAPPTTEKDYDARRHEILSSPFSIQSYYHDLIHIFPGKGPWARPRFPLQKFILTNWGLEVASGYWEGFGMPRLERPTGALKGLEDMSWPPQFRESPEAQLQCHAKLYVLGDRYDIGQLRTLALVKLHSVMTSIIFQSWKDVKLVTPVIRYLCANTVPRDLIQAFLCDFGSFFFKHVKEFQELLNDTPEFNVNLHREMRTQACGICPYSTTHQTRQIGNQKEFCYLDLTFSAAI